MINKFSSGEAPKNSWDRKLIKKSALHSRCCKRIPKIAIHLLNKNWSFRCDNIWDSGYIDEKKARALHIRFLFFFILEFSYAFAHLTQRHRKMTMFTVRKLIRPWNKIYFVLMHCMQSVKILFWHTYSYIHTVPPKGFVTSTHNVRIEMQQPWNIFKGWF